jgi:hypothetical protein
MLSRSKLYTRKEPDKDARLFVIFCEGEKREPGYFKYFKDMASQIKIELVAHVDGRQTPTGLFQTATEILLPDPTIQSPKYDLRSGDEVWFVIDTDDWGSDIAKLREKVGQYEGWYVAQSNPCFEVWLYYHLNHLSPVFEDIGTAHIWKRHLSDAHGGFNSAKQPIYLEVAIVNAKANFAGVIGMPDPGGTEVYLLAEKILPLVKRELDQALNNL